LKFWPNLQLHQEFQPKLMNSVTE